MSDEKEEVNAMMQKQKAVALYMNPEFQELIWKPLLEQKENIIREICRSEVEESRLMRLNERLMALSSIELRITKLIDQKPISESPHLRII